MDKQEDHVSGGSLQLRPRGHGKTAEAEEWCKCPHCNEILVGQRLKFVYKHIISTQTEIGLRDDIRNEYECPFCNRGIYVSQGKIVSAESTDDE